MSSFDEYWEDYKQTNPSWQKLEAKDLVLIGWIGRNKEIDGFMADIQDMTSRLREIEKEMLRQRLEIAKLKMSQGEENE